MAGTLQICTPCYVYMDSNELSLNQFEFLRGKSIPCIQYML